MTVRLTGGGDTPKDAWYLSCDVREKMIAWLREVEGGAYLPQRRVILSERRPADAEETDDGDGGRKTANAGDDGEKTKG